MIPLERYFSSLMPLHKSISPFKSVPKLKEFDAEEFLRNLKQASPELAPNLKGDWHGLYRRFLDSLNFRYWYQLKKIEAEKKLELLQIRVLCDYVRAIFSQAMGSVLFNHFNNGRYFDI